jgi:hypothetical protein
METVMVKVMKMIDMSVELRSFFFLISKRSILKERWYKGYLNLYNNALNIF